MDFLLENFLERAGRAGNQIAHIGQLAEHEIVQCGEQLVELGGIGALGVVRRSRKSSTLSPSNLQFSMLPANRGT